MLPELLLMWVMMMKVMRLVEEISVFACVLGFANFVQSRLDD